MTTTVGPALGTALRAGREQFNGLAVEARLLGGGFAEEAFTDALRGPVDALAEAVDRMDPAAVGPVVEAAYRAVLTLTGRGVEVARRGGGVVEEPVAAVWERLPDMAGLVAADPVRVLGSVTNATLSVAATPGVDVPAWVDRIASLGATLAGEGSAGVGPWLAAGRVVAWTCGMAHQRATALAAIEGLPPSLVAAAAGVDESALASWTPTDRWSRPRGSAAPRDDGRDRGPTHPYATQAPIAPNGTPDGQPPTGTSDGVVDGTPDGLVVGQSVGGFVGFGGPFTRPPRVWLDKDGAIHATGGPDDGVWRLHADAFGSTLVRAARTTVPAGPGAVERWPRVPIPRMTSVAATDDTCAVTTAASHRITIRGRAGGVSS